MEKIENIKSPFMCYCAKVIPLAFDESMSYYECLCNFYNYLKNEIMPAININADATNELQKLYIELKEYVDNYFDNLDISEEVNAKLDEMVENGELQQIIAEYLQLESLWVYDTVSDMKLAENLSEGMTVKTNGYYSYNDGGSAFYRIREYETNEESDEMFTIALYDTTLVAELLYNDINLKVIGAKANNTDDDSNILQGAINKLSNGGNIIIPKGTYLIEDNITIPENTLINFIGENAVLNFNITTGYAMSCLATSPNYSKVTFKNLKIENVSNITSVNGLKFTRLTECKVMDNVRIVGFYDNLTLGNSWSLIFEKLYSTSAINSGFKCEDVTNSFNFLSCIFTNNTLYNIYLTGRGHSFTQCDLSIYDVASYNYIYGAYGVTFNGCYYEENNINKGFHIRVSEGISFNGCYFELRSNVDNYNLIDCNNSYGIGFNNCEFKGISALNDDSYLINIHDGSNVTLNTCNIYNCKNICYVYNANLNVFNNKLDTVAHFITQNNHVYARVYGNLLLATEYTNSILPHPEVVNLHINNQISSGNTSQRPEGVYTGQQYLNTQTDHLDIFNGVSWI